MELEIVNNMSRCNICDYLEGYGSDLYSIPNDHRKVRFRYNFSEFQCDLCHNEYSNLTYNTVDDELQIEEEEQHQNGSNLLQKPMPKVPIE